MPRIQERASAVRNMPLCTSDQASTTSSQDLELSLDDLEITVWQVMNQIMDDPRLTYLS